MKEKIAVALRNKYANLGLGQKAFDGVAAFIEKTIEKEEDIPTAIEAENVANLLKAFQGESDTLRTARQKAERDLEEYKKAHPATKTEETKTADDEVSAKIAELERKQQEYESRIKAEESAKKRNSVVDDLNRMLEEKGCDNKFIRNTTLRAFDIKEGDTAEALIDAIKGEYDKNFKEAYGDGVVPPSGSRQPAEFKEGSFSSEVERLRAAGKIPSATNK